MVTLLPFFGKESSSATIYERVNKALLVELLNFLVEPNLEPSQRIPYLTDLI